MNNEEPKLPGAYDEHPETPLSSAGLDSADADKRVADVRAREAAERIIREESETKEEQEMRLQNLRMLSERYGGKEPTDAQRHMSRNLGIQAQDPPSPPEAA